MIFKILFSSLLVSSVVLAQSQDPLSGAQWGLSNDGSPQSMELDQVTSFRVQGRPGQDIHRPQNLKSSSKKILVAVLDTGIDFTHPDLKRVIHRNESECRALEKFLMCQKDKTRQECEKIWFDLKNPEVDQDKNGYPLDCHGWSILGKPNAANILGQPDFRDEQGHGTHVSGIIAAERNNGEGISGVSSNVEILPVQVLGKKPSEPVKPLSLGDQPKTFDLSPIETGKEAFRQNLGDLVARGVIYAIRSGAQVINFSMGWPESSDSEFLKQAIQEAQSRGILIVAAAGNDSTRALLRPCAYPGVICVASHGPDGSLSHFSNYGTGVTVAAPGTNILSTYPLDLRGIRYRKSAGYDYLHGTSQASPFVAGMVAEMLAQGIPAKDIYARLVLSSRPLLEKLPLLQGSPQNLEVDRTAANPQVEKKFILAGIADLTAALAVQPQSAILPYGKSRNVVSWNRKSKVLTLKFPFQNFWQDANFSQVSVSGRFLKPSAQAVRPTLQSLQFENSKSVWKQNEIRNLIATIAINDTSDPAQSRIPSDLDLEISLKNGSRSQYFVLESEIIVPVTPQGLGPDTQIFGLKLPEMRTSLVSFDETYDGDLRTDYFAISAQSPNNLYFLIKQDASGAYQPAGQFKVNLGKDLDTTVEQITARMMWNGQEPGYVMGLLIDRRPQQDPALFNSLKFFFLNSQFQIQKTFEIQDDKVQLPHKVSWMEKNGMKVPAWVGKGKEADKKPSVRDDWENPNGNERPQIRFYYLDETGKLQALTSHEEYQIIDLLDPSLKQVQAGRVPIILAKNTGTEIKPSYIYDFATAEVVNGKIENFQTAGPTNNNMLYKRITESRGQQVNRLLELVKLQQSLQKSRLRGKALDEAANGIALDLPNLFDGKILLPKASSNALSSGLNNGLRTDIYRNLLDTRVDQVLNLDLSLDRGRGTFWFGEGANRSQRLSVLLNGTQGVKFYESGLSAARGTVDSALWVRAVFAGSEGLGAFTLTNSEIQFHDLSHQQIAVKSYERYTFYPDMAFSNLHYPVVVRDQSQARTLVPGLFTTENSGLNKGVKFKLAVRDANKNLIEIMSPAKLHFQSGQGCRALDNTVRTADGATALDYYCGDKILRLPLSY